MQRKFWLLLLVLSTLLLLTGCDTSWTSQASSIINLIPPALTAVLSLLALFGVGIPVPVLAKIEQVKEEALTDLETVRQLIESYNAVPDADKASVIQKIDATLQIIQGKFNELMTEIHVSNPEVQQKAAAALGAVMGLVESLMLLLPVLQAKGSISLQDAHDVGLLTPKQFKQMFNTIMLAKTTNPELNAKLHQFVIE